MDENKYQYRTNKPIPDKQQVIQNMPNFDVILNKYSQQNLNWWQKISWKQKIYLASTLFSIVSIFFIAKYKTGNRNNTIASSNSPQNTNKPDVIKDNLNSNNFNVLSTSKFPIEVKTAISNIQYPKNRIENFAEIESNNSLANYTIDSNTVENIQNNSESIVFFPIDFDTFIIPNNEARLCVLKNGFTLNVADNAFASLSPNDFLPIIISVKYYNSLTEKFIGKFNLNEKTQAQVVLKIEAWHGGKLVYTEDNKSLELISKTQIPFNYYSAIGNTKLIPIGEFKPMYTENKTGIKNFIPSKSNSKMQKRFKLKKEKWLAQILFPKRNINLTDSIPVFYETNYYFSSYDSIVDSKLESTVVGYKMPVNSIGGFYFINCIEKSYTLSESLFGVYNSDKNAVNSMYMVSQNNNVIQKINNIQEFQLPLTIDNFKLFFVDSDNYFWEVSKSEITKQLEFQKDAKKIILELFRKSKISSKADLELLIGANSVL